MSLSVLGLLAVALAAIATRPAAGQAWAEAVLVAIPDLSQGGAVYPRPWSSQLAVLAGLTCALALAGHANLVLRTVGERRQGRRFLWLWAGTFAAAFLTAGAVAVGQVLGQAKVGSAVGSGLAVEMGHAAVVAVRWGLVPGLAGAAVTTWLAPRRPVAALGRLLYQRAAVVGSLAVATTLAATQLAGVAESAASYAARFAQPAASVPSPAATLKPSAEPSDPALLTNPEPAKAYRGRCAAGSLAVSYRFADAASGTRFGLLTVRNTGKTSCVVKGYPDVAFADVQGNNVRVRYEHGRWDGVSDDKPRPVRLKPGESARAELRWHGDAGAYDREVNTILAAPWAGSRRSAVVDRFDVKNGSLMRVSAWLPTV